MATGYRSLSYSTGLAILLAAAACTDDTADAGDAGPVAQADGATAHCASDRECWDGVFCNGDELCVPQSPEADALGCIPAPTGPCFPTQECKEDSAHCETDCAAEPDADGDGHEAETCGGDDCLDNDATNFPGNEEICDPEGHDEDCDMSTYGFRDDDGDGFGDARCCNIDRDDVSVCGEDCNDARRAVNPNSPETCDDEDNDCDALVDEEVSYLFFVDTDGDGFGDPTMSMSACEIPEEASLTGTDCDDGAAAINPATYDRCDPEMVDDDCDGTANNPAGGCTCEAGEGSRGCALPGACAAGTQSCIDGLWSDCSINPVPETCNGVDDNCDGQVDEGCRCDAGAQIPCGLGIGQCTKGFQVCQQNDTWGACVGAGEPSVELCDKIDNDCDAIVDEDPLSTFFVDADGDGFGNPTMPVPSCGFESGVSSLPLDCNDGDAAIKPGGTETCDNVDSNCNGRLDGPGEDADGDGIAFVDCGGLDCNDDDPTSTSCSSPIFVGTPVLTTLVDLALLSGITEITGDLTINCSAIGNVTQLSALSDLKTVGGVFTIQNCSDLASLTGLSSLKSVGSLIISGIYNANAARGLKNLDGLQALNEVTGTLEISYNDYLEDFSGLSSLVNLEGSLLVRNNGHYMGLTKFAGFEALQTVGGSLELSGCGDGCDYQDSVSGFDDLTSVGGDLIVYGLSYAIAFDGMNALTSVGGNVSIEYNNVLASISGLTSLANIGGDLLITSNYSALTSITGMQQVAGVGGNVDVRNNDLLPSVDFLNPDLTGSLVKVGTTNTGQVIVCANAPAALASGTALTTALAPHGWTGGSAVSMTCPP